MTDIGDLLLLDVQEHNHDDFLTLLDPFAPEPVEEHVAGQPFKATSKIWFRGGWTCSCVVTSLPFVEEAMVQKGLIKNSLDIFQLGYNNGGVAASAGTHDGGGCTDVAQFSDDQIHEWRLWGWTMQHRTVAQGFSGPHAHGWPFGCPHLSAGARAQSTMWKNRQNGLISRGRVQGMWPVKGWKTAMNEGIKRMGFVDDVKKAVRTGLAEEVAKEVLNLDGEIENVFTGNPLNKFVSLKSALVATHQKLNSVDADVANLKQQVVDLSTAVQELQKNQGV